MNHWTKPTGRTPYETVEVPPTHCPNGHELKPGSLIHGSSCEVSWFLCRICGLRIDRYFASGIERVVQAQPC